VLFCLAARKGAWTRSGVCLTAVNNEGAVSVRLFIGNLPYTATEADLREHLSSVGAPTSVVLPVDRETGRPRGFAFVDYADRAIAEQAIQRFDQQPFRGRPLAVSEARPREERGPGGPRPGGYGGPRPGGGPTGPRPGGFSGPRPGGPGGPPGGYSAPRPGGFAPRTGEAPGGRNKNFGPDAPPKHKRKQKDRNDRGPRGPIKERPVGRLYDADEDWRAADQNEEELEIDNIATHKEEDDAAATHKEEVGDASDKEADDDAGE
jgi:cold-inducible RNA-binding protein